MVRPSYAGVCMLFMAWLPRHCHRSRSHMAGIQVWLISPHLCSVGQVSVSQCFSDPTRPLAPGTCTLQAQCRAEASEPCPRAILVCCVALASGALQTPGIFREPCHDRQADIHLLLGALHAGMPPHSAEVPSLWPSRLCVAHQLSAMWKGCVLPAAPCQPVTSAARTL